MTAVQIKKINKNISVDLRDTLSRFFAILRGALPASL